MTRRIPLVAALAMAAVFACTAFAEEPALKPVACGPADLPFPPASASANQFKDADKESGLGEKAKVLTAMIPGEKTLSFKVALDGADAPEQLFLDLGNTGKFDKSAGIPIQKKEPKTPLDFSGVFGPVEVKATINGRPLLVNVFGSVVRYQKACYVTMLLCAAVQGPCAFGAKEHPVRLMDGTGAFTFDRAGKAKLNWMGTVGDIVMIDTGDGKFTSPIRAFLGQPVQVDGAWYEVTVADGKPTAKAVEVKASAVTVPSDQWDTILLSEERPLMVCGGTKEVAIPAGKYKPMYVRVWAAKDAAKPGFALLGAGSGKDVEAIEGKTATLVTPLPFKGELKAAVAPGRKLTISYGVKTQDSLSVSAMGEKTLLDQPTPPKVTVFDEANKEVYQATMEFG
jgi:hypothetical protein